MSRTIARAGAAFTLALLTVACLSERERLTAPIVTLELDSDSVAAGDSIAGTVTATDRSGIVLLVIAARSTDSTFVLRRDRVREESIVLEFKLRVARTAPAFSVVEVVASAVDNQNFEVVVRDTAWVRGTP